MHEEWYTSEGQWKSNVTNEQTTERKQNTIQTLKHSNTKNGEAKLWHGIQEGHLLTAVNTPVHKTKLMQ